METTHYNNIVLHIPHASKSFPIPFLQFMRSITNIAEELIRLTPAIDALTDTYTDELFAPPVDADEKYLEHFEVVQFPYTRIYCDVERLINDPLEQQGFGIIYRWTNLGGTLVNHYPAMHYAYVAHHCQLMTALSHKCLLLDCHSFS